LNLFDLHIDNKTIEAKIFYKTASVSAVSISIKQNEELKEHISKTQALLICILGDVDYVEEGRTKQLKCGDYVIIEPNIKHKLIANLDSNLMLIK
jgi:quercetin dioxygenase-like cupin family protein